MQKKKISPMAYAKVGLVLALYSYVLISSGYRSWQGIRDHEDVMKPLMYFALALLAGIYVIFNKPGKPNPLDAKVSPYIITLLIIIILGAIGYVFWFSIANT